MGRQGSSLGDGDAEKMKENVGADTRFRVFALLRFKRAAERNITSTYIDRKRGVVPAASQGCCEKDLTDFYDSC